MFVMYITIHMNIIQHSFTDYMTIFCSTTLVPPVSSIKLQIHISIPILVKSHIEY